MVQVELRVSVASAAVVAEANGPRSTGWSAANGPRVVRSVMTPTQAQASQVIAGRRTP